MFDMMGMMKKVKELQANMEVAKTELELINVEGIAGHGAVKILLTATGTMKNIMIDDSLLSDKDTLEDLIVIAFEDARAKAATVTADKMAPLTNGLPIPPGMKLF